MKILQLSLITMNPKDLNPTSNLILIIYKYYHNFYSAFTSPLVGLEALHGIESVNFAFSQDYDSLHGKTAFSFSTFLLFPQHFSDSGVLACPTPYGKRPTG